MPPLAPHWRAPAVQIVVHRLQLPPTQYSFARHEAESVHVVHPFASFTQVSTPLPLHWRAPTAHDVPQTPHAPPLQKVPHVCPDCHEVHPDASLTQVCVVLPAHCLLPAVQVPLHAMQEPPEQRLPLWQLWVTHAVQPLSTSHAHS